LQMLSLAAYHMLYVFCIIYIFVLSSFIIFNNLALMIF